MSLFWCWWRRRNPLISHARLCIGWGGSSRWRRRLSILVQHYNYVFALNFSKDDIFLPQTSVAATRFETWLGSSVSFSFVGRDGPTRLQLLLHKHHHGDLQFLCSLNMSSPTNWPERKTSSWTWRTSPFRKYEYYHFFRKLLDLNRQVERIWWGSGSIVISIHTPNINSSGVIVTNNLRVTFSDLFITIKHKSECIFYIHIKYIANSEILVE